MLMGGMLVGCARPVGELQSIPVENGEAFTDWSGVSPLARDAQSAAGSGVDFGRLWVTNDEHSLLLRLEVGAELNIQDRNRIALYLDTDSDAHTGLTVGGIGAELEWQFGRREGRVFFGGDTVPIEHHDIGLMTTPTVTSRVFGIAIDRHARPLPTVRLFSGSDIRIAVLDGAADGDRLPDSTGGIAYTFRSSGTPVAPIALEKHDPAHLRVLSYNINNRLFRPARKEAYRRIVSAIDPELLVFQEVRQHTSGDVVAYVAPMLGKSRDMWYHAKAGGEATVVMSPFPIVSSYPLGESAGFLLDLDAKYGTRLLLVGLSAPCCNNNAARQSEMDLIMAFLRDAMTPGGVLDVDRGTPILLIGDANLVGDRRQRETLLTGEISDVEKFGPAFRPDWDGTSFTDLMPRHTHRRLAFTWFGRDYSPGRLDYVIYSDAVLSIGNRFVLYTPHMPPDVLQAYGLERDDVLRATNHLPVVADLVLSGGKAR